MHEFPLDGICDASTLTHDQLYLVLEHPARLVQFDYTTGKTLRTVPLVNFLPSTIAVFPARNLAFFPGNDLIQGMHLDTGEIFPTGVGGSGVVAHPSLDLLYSYSVSEYRRVHFDQFAFAGPFALRQLATRVEQGMLTRSRVLDNGLLVEEVRLNAAATARHINISPDGHWVTVIGMEGWQPSASQGKMGQGVTVFAADDFSVVLDFYPLTRFSEFAAFNPVTGQLAGVSTATARVYDMADTSHLTSLTPAAAEGAMFRPAAAWSGNGAYLVLGANKGVAVYRNSLLPAEVARAKTWPQTLPTPEPRFTPAAPVVAAVQASPVIAAFTPAKDEKTVAAQVQRAVAQGRTTTPPAWRTFPDYAVKDDLATLLADAEHGIANDNERGVLLFRLRQAVKEHPTCYPLHFFLAQGLALVQQGTEAEGVYLQVIHGDAGRTALAIRALNALAQLCLTGHRKNETLSCLAAAWYLDRADEETVHALPSLLADGNYAAALQALAKTGGPAPPAQAAPKLTLAADTSHTFTGPELYARAVESVVLIASTDGTGSGICLGAPEYVLTNAHVVGTDRLVTVTPYLYKNGKARAMASITADVVYRAPQDDLALLHLRTDSPLTPLPILAGPLQGGTRVYAIGNPGLGDQILTQSISEGIVSAPERQVEHRFYLQHTAAVNPGNSGGPLLDEHGQVVGIITLKASLDSVSFAIPAARLRALFAP